MNPKLPLDGPGADPGGGGGGGGGVDWVASHPPLGVQCLSLSTL